MTDLLALVVVLALRQVAKIMRWLDEQGPADGVELVAYIIDVYTR